MMFIDEFLFPGTENSSLSARIYSNKTCNNKGIIFSHGLFSTMDGYKIKRLAGDIVSAGYNLMTFNFSSAEDFTATTRNISILKQVRELGCAVNEFRKRGITNLHLMGSSMGAAVSILYASSAPETPDSLVLIATPLDPLAIIPGMTADKALKLDESGYSEISGIMVNNGFFREISHISITDAVEMINCPVLLIHGNNDQVVDFSNFSLFLSHCRTDCSPLVIDQGDHNLNNDKDLEMIRVNIIKWLGKLDA